MNRRQFVFSCAALSGVRPLLRGQQQEEPTFSTEVKVVNILATVRKTRREKLVPGLTKDDFSLLLEKSTRPQTIRAISRVSRTCL